MEKHIIVTGSSEVSWKDAIVKTVAEASKTLDYINRISILNQRADVDGKKIVKYYVDIELTFTIDRDRD